MNTDRHLEQALQGTAVAPRGGSWASRSIAPANGSYTRIDYDRYVVLPIWYYCNSKCTFCMVERQIGELPTVNLAQFEKIVRGIVEAGQHDSLILSGAEVTTFAGLEEYIRLASSFGWFRRIQIQTNARKLADREYTARLVDAGLNEVFISMHGYGELQDVISEVRGSWDETLAGFENIAAHEHVNMITNTVLTTRNFAGLVELMDWLCSTRVSEMHMWNFFPMAGEDRHDLLVSIQDFYALLPDLLALFERARKPIVFKGFPECLSLGKPGFFDNKFPLNLIDKAFWENFDENQFGRCVYKAECKAKSCFGLSAAYVKKFGTEAGLLCAQR